VHRAPRFLIVSFVTVGSVACSFVTSFHDLTGGAPADAASADATSSSDAPASGSDAAMDASSSTSDGTAAPSDAASVCPAPVADLLAYFPLDDGAGSTATDCSGNGVKLDIRGTDVQWIAGHTGGALAFGGVSGCAEVPLPTPPALSFDGTKAFTVALWVRLDAYSTAWPRAFVAGHTADPSKAGWRMGIENSSRAYNFVFGSADGGTAQGTGANSVVTGTWHHFAAVFAVGIGTTSIVLDGVVKSTAPAAPFVQDTLNVRVGCSSDNQNFLIGAVDELRIYDRALTATEIMQIAQ
jgi:hypothetical protein